MDSSQQGKRDFVGLDTEFSRFCREDYVKFCVFNTPVYDKCSSALCCGKPDAANELCKTVLFGPKFEPTFVLVLKNHANWLYSLHDPRTLGCEYPSEARKYEYIDLMGAGLQPHLPTCRLQNELLTLSVGRTFKSEYQTEPNTLTVPILADINLTGKKK